MTGREAYMAAVNRNFAGLRSSASIVMMDKARALKAQGMDIISLAGGEPDFDTPEAVVEAGVKAIRDGHTHYTMGRGIVPFRERICQKLREGELRAVLAAGQTTAELLGLLDRIR